MIDGARRKSCLPRAMRAQAGGSLRVLTARRWRTHILTSSQSIKAAASPQVFLVILSGVKPTSYPQCPSAAWGCRPSVLLQGNWHSLRAGETRKEVIRCAYEPFPLLWRSQHLFLCSKAHLPQRSVGAAGVGGMAVQLTSRPAPTVTPRRVPMATTATHLATTADAGAGVDTATGAMGPVGARRASPVFGLASARDAE
jgi:hypothetical protein